MTIYQADWGPVFVHGPMLLPAVWAELIGRVPEMAPWALIGRWRGQEVSLPVFGHLSDSQFPGKD